MINYFLYVDKNNKYYLFINNKDYNDKFLKCTIRGQGNNRFQVYANNFSGDLQEYLIDRVKEFSDDFLFYKNKWTCYYNIYNLQDYTNEINKLINKKRVAFGCQMGVGKDTACEYLIKKYGGQQLSFARPLYNILHFAQNTCGFAIEKDRQFLQLVGDWAREKDPEFATSVLLNKLDKNNNFFVSDVRYLNEFDALKKNNFIMIKLIRNNVNNRVGTGSSDHNSEILLNDCPNISWDYIIENNGDINEFYKKINQIIDKHF